MIIIYEICTRALIHPDFQYELGIYFSISLKFEELFVEDFLLEI